MDDEALGVSKFAERWTPDCDQVEERSCVDVWAPETMEVGLNRDWLNPATARVVRPKLRPPHRSLLDKTPEQSYGDRVCDRLQIVTTRKTRPGKINGAHLAPVFTRQ